MASVDSDLLHCTQCHQISGRVVNSLNTNAPLTLSWLWATIEIITETGSYKNLYIIGGHYHREGEVLEAWNIVMVNTITFLFMVITSNRIRLYESVSERNKAWSLKPRPHLADLNAELSRPWWSGEVLWSRKEVGKERGWVLEGPERSANFVEVLRLFPIVLNCSQRSGVIEGEE